MTKIDITDKGALYYDALRKKTSRTRYEEAEYEILRALWDEREIIGGPIKEEHLEVYGIVSILTRKYLSWDRRATRDLVTKTIKTLKELDHIEEV